MPVQRVSLQQFYELYRQEEPQPLEELAVVLERTDAAYAMGTALTGPCTGLPRLRHFILDDSRNDNPHSFPGNVNHVRNLSFARRLESFTAKMKNGSVRFDSAQGKWSAKVSVKAQPVEPFARVFAAQGSNVSAIVFSAQVAIAPAARRVLAEWQRGSGGRLEIVEPARSGKAR